MAIIGISSVHRLKTLIEAGAIGSLPACGTLDATAVAAGQACSTVTSAGVMWQTIIHAIFILSAVGITLTDKLMASPPKHVKPAA